MSPKQVYTLLDEKKKKDNALFQSLLKGYLDFKPAPAKWGVDSKHALSSQKVGDYNPLPYIVDPLMNSVSHVLPLQCSR